MKSLFNKLIIAALLCIIGATSYAKEGDKTHFYVIRLHKEINTSSARLVTDALRHAESSQADY